MLPHFHFNYLRLGKRNYNSSYYVQFYYVLYFRSNYSNYCSIHGDKTCQHKHEKTLVWQQFPYCVISSSFELKVYLPPND